MRPISNRSGIFSKRWGFKIHQDALLDPGSSLSLVSYALYAKLFEATAAGPLRFQKAIIKHAQGEPLSVVGRSAITFTLIGKNELNHHTTAKVVYDFTVIERLACPLILGNDFHKHCACQIDSGTAQIYFPITTSYANFDVSALRSRSSPGIPRCTQWNPPFWNQEPFVT